MGTRIQTLKKRSRYTTRCDAATAETKAQQQDRIGEIMDTPEAILDLTP